MQERGLLRHGLVNFNTIGMDQILEKLFESVPKVRLLRLFMHNPDESITGADTAKRTQLRMPAARKELGKLVLAGIIKEKNIKVVVAGKRKTHYKKVAVFRVNSDFPLFPELRDLVVKSSVASRKKILSQIKSLGRVRLAVLSGVFVNSENARTDLLLVGDDIRKGKLDNFLARTESELGKSIQHTLMDTEEFRYRLGMYDRFLRDILEYPHEKLINRLDI